MWKKTDSAEMRLNESLIDCLWMHFVVGLRKHWSYNQPIELSVEAIPLDLSFVISKHCDYVSLMRQHHIL